MSRADGWRLPPAGEVREIENQFIGVSDGERLAVQIWLPADAAAHPSPVVLEYIPYRKRDRYRAYGAYWGQTLARYGLAYARLETRGTGNSTGLLADEYLPVERRDGAEAIAWLAAQPWCNGAVGMRGVSWGGFSTLQAAALAPPALKAIMPMCASDMRFTDDAHYIGGAFGLTGLKWATSMKLVMAGPPDPLITREAWEAQWRARLDATPAIAARWLSHQANDAYWRDGSVGLDWDAIRCPAYVVGGLADPYANLIPRLLSALKAPRKGLIGPWRHGYPAPASPGPGLDWALEEVRWWRHWLIGEATGIMDEPVLRVFMPNATAAKVSPGPIPGRWVAEPAWPSARVRTRRFRLGAGGLCDMPQAAETVTLDGAALVGLGKIEWVPFAPSEEPAEQSADDARSACFDSAPLAEAVEVLGVPALTARVTADRPAAHMAARLCEVDAGGRSWLVGFGLLDLAHRDGHEQPAPLIPGRAYDVVIAMPFLAHRFAAGSRVRLALSASLWPLVWPPPEPPMLNIDLARTFVDLPVRAPPARERPMPIAPAPAAASDPPAWPRLTIGQANGVVIINEVWPESGGSNPATGARFSGAGPDLDLSMGVGEPLTCRWSAEQRASYDWPDRRVSLRAWVAVRADVVAFHVEEKLEATLNGESVAAVRHVTTTPRAGG